FRKSILDFGKSANEYKYIILMGIAVIVMFSIAFYLRSQRREQRYEYAMKIITSEVKVSHEDIKELSEKVKGDPIEPWVLLAYGNRLFEDYQDKNLPKGDKSKLELAKTVFEQVRDKFKKRGSAYFCALKSLEVIEEELKFSLKSSEKKPASAPADTPKESSLPNTGGAAVKITPPGSENDSHSHEPDSEETCPT
ncbi:MAG: hypothetical protein ABIH42_04665, partial [Planctomycetota bacterium]